LVDATTILKLKLAPGGGAAISLIPANENDMKKYQKYQ